MSTLSDIVSTAAPIAGKILSSFVPGGEFIVAGLSKLFGADNEQDLITKIENDPESYIKLRKFEADHEHEMLDLVLKDKQSARSREIEYTKTTGARDYIVAFLAISVIIGYFAILGASWWVHTAWLEKLITSALDEWKMCVVLILSYYFGAMYKK